MLSEVGWMQAELFILRLSRSSGVLGLAGTAFASEIFSQNLQLDVKHMKNRSILLVRPLLDLWKEDMYKVIVKLESQELFIVLWLFASTLYLIY